MQGFWNSALWQAPASCAGYDRRQAGAHGASQLAAVEGRSKVASRELGTGHVKLKKVGRQ